MARRGGGSGRGSRQPQKSKDKTPKLVRWNHDLDIQLLLAIPYFLQKMGVKIPWDKICEEYFGPPFTEGAIVQHLAKLRVHRIEPGLKVPPPLRRSPKEAEKQAAAQKRKAEEKKEAESEWEDVAEGLFIEEDEDDEEYMPTPKRAKKNKSKNRSTSETAPATTTVASANWTQPTRFDPMGDPSPQFEGDYPYHPSWAPSPFDSRYRDSNPTSMHIAGTPRAHGASTAGSPVNTVNTVNTVQPQAVATNVPGNYPGQFQPWPMSTYPPVYPAAAYGEQNFGMHPQMLSFDPANQAYPMPPPTYPAYSMAPPASAFSAGRPMTGSANNMTSGQNFGAGYGSQQNPVQPAENQGSEATHPHDHQSDSQSEVKQEGETFDPEGVQDFNFDEFLKDDE